MPIELRRQAAQLLTWALTAQKEGHTAKARELTMRAADRLEDASGLERVRQRVIRNDEQPKGLREAFVLGCNEAR
jgi:hypothetical protein